MPANAKLTIEGRFPRSRYMSLISYDGAGVPIESVADYLIQPAPGSANPFGPGADRAAEHRDYRLEVVDGKPDPNQPVGMNIDSQARAALHAPKYGTAPGQQVVLYRIYARDIGSDEIGNAGLPEPVLTYADGKVLRGAQSCAPLRVRQPLQLEPAAMAVPMGKYHELLAAAARRSPTAPATVPPTWYQQLDRDALYGIHLGTPPNPNARKSEGGFYPNLDNQYIRTIVNRRLGKVFVVRAKAPTTPHTVHGDPRMGGGQLRYWSWCSNQGFANTRVNDCVHDENIPVGPDGYYTLVLSRAADRPRNAVAQCGIAWLPMADDGDGAGDPDVTVLHLRNLLGAGEFRHAVQGVAGPETIARNMGEYYPQGRYISPSAFGIAVPWLLEKRRDRTERVPAPVALRWNNRGVRSP